MSAWENRKYVEILEGMTMSAVERASNDGDDEIVFIEQGGRRFRMFHDQDCCESVTIEDICGDLSDLVGSPILHAEECSGDEAEGKPNEDYTPESCTWTFYKFATAKGYVTIRWYGESNGYYSETVDIEELAQVDVDEPAEK